LLQDRII